MIRRLLHLLVVVMAVMAPSVASVAFAQVASGPFNVRLAPYSAFGDGIHDDTAAFNAAIAAVPASGGEIYIPAGRYILSNTLTVVDKPIAFRGEGQQISVLVWSNAPAWTPGISFTSSPPVVPPPPNPAPVNKTLAVRSLSLLRAGTSGGAAISASWPEPPSHIAFGAVTTTIEDVHIASDPWPTNGGNYWAWGIRLAHVTCVKINTFSIQGPGPGGGYAAISIGGTFNGDQTITDPHSSIAVYLRNGDISSYVRGIEIKDASEGAHINDVSIRDSWWALQLTGPAPGTAITNNQLSAQLAGIETSSITDLAITDNTILQEPGQNFIGVHMTTAYNVRLIGNTIVSTSPASSNGVIFDTIGENGIIEANTIQGVTNGIWLRGTFNGWLVRGNVLRVTATPVVNGGANFIVNNF